MYKHFKYKPLWYQLWVVSIVLSILYYIIRCSLYDETLFDYGVLGYALTSLVLYNWFFKEIDK